MLLALDTSAAISVALLTSAGETLAERSVAERRRHAEALAPMIAEVLTDAGRSLADLTAIAVGTGPAPYTGLRVGLVSAKMLAHALGIPAFGVCSLDTVAAAVSSVEPSVREVIVVADARRKEVYWAQYRLTSGEPVLTAGPQVARPADLAAELATSPADSPPSLVGEGCALYPDLLPATLKDPFQVTAAALGRLALVRAARGANQPVEPQYLRRPDVHEPGACAPARAAELLPEPAGLSR